MNRSTRLVPGAIFRHYKNKPYLIVGVATHTETSEELVVYRLLRPIGSLQPVESFDNYQLWVRPKEMFLETVEVNGEIRPRFEFVAES